MIWLAEKISRKLQSSLLDDTAAAGDVQALLAFARHVNARINVFRTAVENKHLVYENVYQFYLSSQKVSIYRWLCIGRCVWLCLFCTLITNELH